MTCCQLVLLANTHSFDCEQTQETKTVVMLQDVNMVNKGEKDGATQAI